MVADDKLLAKVFFTEICFQKCIIFCFRQFRGVCSHRDIVWLWGIIMRLFQRWVS